MDFYIWISGICELASQFWNQPSLCFKRVFFNCSADKKGTNPHNDQEIVEIYYLSFDSETFWVSSVRHNVRLWWTSELQLHR